MLALCTDVSFGALNHIIQSPLGCSWQSPALSCTHGNTEADTLSFHFGSLLDPLIAGVGVDNCLLTIQYLGSGGEVVHIGGGGFHRVDEASVLVNADVDLPLRGPAATYRNTTGCPSWSGASQDPSPPSRSSASGTLGLRPR